jgi:signal transduction histidine kinase
MDSFLGVPIVQKGRQVGSLYLTDKIGALEFTEADQAIIELLASHASIALHNARLYQATLDRSQELQERNRELAAVNVIAEAISAHLDLNRVMTEALDQMLAVTQAEVGEIFLLEETSDELTLALHRGPFAQEFQSVARFRRGEGFPGRVMELGRPLVSTDITQDARYVRRAVVEAGFKSYISIPLFAKGKVVGTLDLTARQPDLFNLSALPLLSGIGHQIGTAVENARLHRQVANLAVLEERQRIGMDLHDGVIQSIYAVGLTLDYIDAQLADGDMAGARERLRQAAQALTATIRDIRSYILDLRPRRFDGGDLVAGLRQLIGEFKANTLITVELQADPQANLFLTPDSRLALFHIAQEALSNAAKHSRAARMKVSLVKRAADIELVLQDNGRGFEINNVERRVGHGLTNMHDRAQAIGGVCSLSSDSDGTTVRVVLPGRAA